MFGIFKQYDSNSFNCYGEIPLSVLLLKLAVH